MFARKLVRIAAVLAALALLVAGAARLLRSDRALGGGAEPEPLSEADPDEPVTRATTNVAKVSEEPEAPAVELELGATASSTDERVVLAAPFDVELLLLDSRGDAVERARWVAFRGDEVLADGTTEADGAARVRVDPTASDGTDPFELAATCQGFAPVRAVAQAEPGTRVIALGGGLSLTGIARIDGTAPGAPLALRLSGDEPFWSAAELPAPAATVLLRRPRDVSMLTTATDDEGAFRFEGLLPGWKGELAWSRVVLANPPPVEQPWMTPRSRSIDVAVPSDRIVLDLLSPLELVGRVVDPAGEPVERPMINASWTDGAMSWGTDGAFAADGTFRFEFEHGMPERVELEVGDATGGARARHVVAIPSGVRSHDAGDLAISAARSVAFRVIAASGQPIEGATVEGRPKAVDASWKPARSDEDGRGAISVPPLATELRVVALGFEAASVPLPPASAAEDESTPPVEIVLASAPTLVVQLPPDAGGLLVSLLFDDEPPFWTDGAPSWTAQVGPGVATYVRKSAGGSARYATGEDGRAIFAGLRPGLPLRVAASDAYDNLVGEREVAPLLPGERRTIELVLDRELRAFAGRVVDASGTPLPGAVVMVGSVDGDSHSGRGVDAEGRFRYDAIAADRVQVIVEKPGLPARRWREVVLDGTPVELALGPARELRVHVVGTAGEPVRNLRITPSKEADEWWTGEPEEESPGVYLVRSAPLGAVDFAVSVGGRTFRGRVDTDESSTRVVVGALQGCTIAVEVPADLPPGDRVFVTLARVDGEPGDALSRRLDPGVRELEFDVLPGRFVATAQAQGVNSGARPLAEPLEFVVVPGEPARVALELAER